jgi:hypothetical protein
MRRRRHNHGQPQSHSGALALAIERSDWERASLLILLAIARAARSAPPDTIDDVLALISFGEEAGDAEVRS